MTAKVIVITNQKGGCGKTTITMNLSGAFGKDAKTLVVDGDPQGSTTRWAASSSDENPFPCSVMSLANLDGKVNREIKKYIDDYEYIFIDCPPAIDNRFTASALLVANLAIVPVVPSPTDLWSAIGIQNLINSALDFNENLQTRLLANMCQPNTSISREALELIGEFDFDKFDTDIYQRTAYRQAAAFGGTVLDLDNAKAKEEITALKQEIIKILN